MPVIFNEPLSFLQRLAEYMEYAHLLHEATQTEDPIRRLQLVTTFMVSCNAATDKRLGKPFNPLLGETFELVRDDFRLVAEQVSHHPPISALHVEGKSGFVVKVMIEPRIKFWGKDVEVKLKGVFIVRIPKYNDVYHFAHINSLVHNIIIGTLWLELYGQCEVRNLSTKDTANVNFKAAGWFGGGLNHVEGHLSNGSGERLRYMKGDWTQFMCSSTAIDSELLESVKHSKLVDDENVPPGVDVDWRATPKPKHSATMYYSMTEFAMGLNELLPAHDGVIAVTDSRYRPDIRFMESGNIEAAAAEKHRLEEKQRATRRRMEGRKESWKPRWFTLELRNEMGKEFWTYNGKYFNREFDGCPDIY